jgi:hypothetical protein
MHDPRCRKFVCARGEQPSCKAITHRTADIMKIAAVLLTSMQRNPEVEDSKRLLLVPGSM